MLQDLNCKISIIKSNNSSLQVIDNKPSFLSYHLNNNSIGLNDSFENSSQFDYFSFKNEIATLEKPLIN